jgi:hypothetical protein
MGWEFNVIRSKNENVGVSFDLCNMQAFNDLISIFGLIDYKGNNCKYSWARGGVSTQLALLDKFLINFFWGGSICFNFWLLFA